MLRYYSNFLGRAEVAEGAGVSGTGGRGEGGDSLVACGSLLR